MKRKLPHVVDLICLTLGLSAILGGLYVISPFLVLDAPSTIGAFYKAAAHPYAIAALGGASLFSGISIVSGIYKQDYKWVSKGLFIGLILRLYIFIIGLLVYGLQATWLNVVFVIVINIIMYIYVRVERL